MKNPNIKVLKICVTKMDIAKGIRKHHILCPIARALRRQTRANYVCVDTKSCWFGSHGRRGFWNAVSVSKKVNRFIKKFDAHGKQAVKPEFFNIVFKYDGSL